MSVQPARIVASLSLLAGGLVIAVSVLAIGSAGLLVGAGMSIRPSDAALLDDLIAVLPFIAGFALLSVVAGAGLIAGNETAETLAIGTSIAAVVVGVLGLSLIVVGRDPFAGAGSTADGIGVIGAFTFVYSTVLVSLAAARTGDNTSSPKAVAS